MRKFTLIVLVLLSATAVAQQIKILGDFEGSVEPLIGPNTGGTKFQVVQEHATRGQSALKVTCTGQYPGLQFTQHQDWSDFTLLKFDVFNPGDTNIAIHIDVRDEQSNVSGQWADRCGKGLQIEPGSSELELNITSLKCNANPRLIDISKLQGVLFFIGKVKGTKVFYVDNIRLEKPEELKTPNSFAFDFGPKGSAVFPGFTPVGPETIFGQGQQWGWERKQGDARDRTGTPEALCTDFVRANGTFQVELPNGKYRFWLIRADSGDWGFLQHWKRRIIKAENNTVSNESMTRQEFNAKKLYVNLDHEDLPGGDVWTDYIVPRWKEETFEAVVTDGRLDLRFQGDSWGNTLNCLVVYPTAHSADAEAWLKKVNAAREANFRKTYVEVVPADGKLKKTREHDGTIVWKPVEDPTQKFHEPTAAEKDRGYVIFGRPFADTILPKSRPRSTELIRAVNCAMARDEYEPMVFSLFPLKDLGKVTVELSDLTNAKGQTFPTDYIQPGWVEYKLHRTGLHSTSYRCMPRLIRKSNICQAYEGICRRFWYTLQGPPSAAGRYNGKLTIRAEKGGETELAVSVEVRPFKLEERMDRYFVLCSSMKLDQRFMWYKDEAGAWERLEEHWKDYRAHGFNFIHTGLKGERLDRAIKITQKYGSADTLKIGCHRYQHMDTSKALDAFLNFARPYVKMAKERNWPKITFVLLDEPANDPSLRKHAIEAMNVLQPARKEGILFTGDINGRNDDIFFKTMDYTGMNDGLNISPATLKKCRDAGSIPWLVNTGKKRFYWGYWFYKASEEYDVEYKEDYAYMTWHGDPYFDLDQWNPDFCASFPGPDGPINSPWYEECREGIDDFRYLSMLGNEVKRTGDAEAKAYLAQVLEPVNLDLSENTPWDGKRCDTARAETASLITRLRGLTAAPPAAAPITAPSTAPTAPPATAAVSTAAPEAASAAAGVAPPAVAPVGKGSDSMLFIILGISVVVIGGLVVFIGSRSKRKPRRRGREE